jgi:hypothetical protein
VYQVPVDASQGIRPIELQRQEVIMGEKFDKFCSDLRAKIDDADKHLKGLQASAKNAGQKARDDGEAYLAALEAIEAVIAWIDADAVPSKAASRPDRKSNSSSNNCQQRSLQ